MVEVQHQTILTQTSLNVLVYLRAGRFLCLFHVLLSTTSRHTNHKPGDFSLTNSTQQRLRRNIKICQKLCQFLLFLLYQNITFSKIWTNSNKLKILVKTNHFHTNCYFPNKLSSLRSKYFMFQTIEVLAF